MGLSKFLNLKDARQAVRNPRLAYRVLSRNLGTDASATNVSKSTEYDSDRIDAFQSLFDVEPSEVESLLAELRESDVHQRIERCEEVFEDRSYGVGGMKSGGETAYVAARLLEPRSVLEIGVANGVSTTYLLGAADHGNFDVDIRGINRPQFEYMIRERRGKRGLKGVGGIIPDSKEAGWIALKSQRAAHGYQYYVGDFTEVLSSVASDMDPLGLALYDASKDTEEMRMAYERLRENLAPGGMLISDDVGVNSAFENALEDSDGELATFGGCGLYRDTKI